MQTQVDVTVNSTSLLDMGLRAHCVSIEAKLETTQGIINSVFHGLPTEVGRWMRDFITDTEGNFLGHLEDDLAATKKDILVIVGGARQSLLSAEATISAEFEMCDAYVNSRATRIEEVN